MVSKMTEEIAGPQGTFGKGEPTWVGLVSPLMIQVWISAPTGDSSDSIICNIPCKSAIQALNLIELWNERWGLEV